MLASTFTAQPNLRGGEPEATQSRGNILKLYTSMGESLVKTLLDTLWYIAYRFRNLLQGPKRCHFLLVCSMHETLIIMMIQCEECEVWHLVYSKYKLTASERSQLNSALADYTYTCGASLSDLELSGRLTDVCTRTSVKRPLSS